jgi:outer membrane protein assembly factor BamB
MKNVKRLIGLVVGGAVLAGASCMFAQDWPQWRGPNRDGKVSGFTAPQAWPANLAQKWKVTVGLGDSSPALVDGKLYIFARQGDEEVTLCLNAADGKTVWTNSYAAPAVSPPDGSQHSGPRSSPAVANGKVFTLGVGGTLSCLDAATGKMLWRKDEFPGTPRFHTGMSPIVVDGLCIAHLGGQGNGAIVAYDLATGDQKWKWTGEGPAYASPALMTVEGTKQIVAMTDKSVVGVAAADGKLLWQVPFAASGMAYNAATPIVDGQTVIFTGQGRGTKAVKIEKTADGFAATNILWSAQTGTQFNTPVLKDGVLYGLSDRGMFFCINAKDGSAGWTDTTRRGGNYAAMLDAGAVILALPSNSELTVIKPSDKEYSEVAKIKVADTPVYASPLVVGNKVYVKDRDSLTLWAIE